MTIIEASSVRVNTMADGTLRLTVDIEPRHAIDAFRLFAAPGTAMGLAALKSQADPEPSPEPAAKGGAIAKWCALRENDENFKRWLSLAYPTYLGPVAEIIRDVCGVKSRAELDNDREAAARFHRQIRLPYQEWAAENMVTA